MKDGGPLVQCSYQRHYSWTKSSSSPVILTPTQRVYTDASAPQNPQTLPLYPDLSSLSTGAKEKTNLSLRDLGTTSPTSKENTERKLSYILRLVLLHLLLRSGGVRCSPLSVASRLYTQPVMQTCVTHQCADRSCLVNYTSA